MSPPWQILQVCPSENDIEADCIQQNNNKNLLFFIRLGLTTPAGSTFSSDWPPLAAVPVRAAGSASTAGPRQNKVLQAAAVYGLGEVVVHAGSQALPYTERSSVGMVRQGSGAGVLRQTRNTRN